MKIKFAHLSDIHLGAWRNENLNQVGYEAFSRAIDIIIEENVDFVIISGDLYDISNPKVDVVDLAITKLRELNDNGITVYGIMGSHDFSPSGKTMIRPLKSAGFFTDVGKGKMEDDVLNLFFTEDKKTNIKFTGIRARKRSLEIEDYKALNTESLEKEEGLKIFLLHTLLQELKPLEYKDMASMPKSVLPNGFLYYAGGHMHKTVPEKLRQEKSLKVSEKLKVIYPGCLFPTNFLEIEKFHHGGFCMVSGEVNKTLEDSNLEVRFVPVKIKEIITLNLNCNDKSVQQVLVELDDLIKDTDFSDKIVTLRMSGTLSSGKSFEIKGNEIYEKIKNKGAYEILINKSAVITKEYSSVRVSVGNTNEEIENVLIHEHSQKTKIEGISKEQLEHNIHDLLEAIGKERKEGTKVNEYNIDLIESFLDIFQLKEESE